MPRDRLAVVERDELPSRRGAARAKRGREHAQRSLCGGPAPRNRSALPPAPAISGHADAEAQAHYTENGRDRAELRIPGGRQRPVESWPAQPGPAGDCSDTAVGLGELSQRVQELGIAPLRKECIQPFGLCVCTGRVPLLSARIRCSSISQCAPALPRPAVCAQRALPHGYGSDSAARSLRDGPRARRRGRVARRRAAACLPVRRCRTSAAPPIRPVAQWLVLIQGRNSSPPA